MHFSLFKLDVNIPIKLPLKKKLMGAYIPLMLIFLLGFIIVASFFLLWEHHDPSQLTMMLFGPVIALTGATSGFYLAKE